MKVAELLRQFADMLDHAESGHEEQAMPNHAELAPVEVDHTDHTEPETMVPPLQQKLELLKKAVDVPNMFDNSEPSELDIIKKNAGLNPAAIHIATDDEPEGF